MPQSRVWVGLEAYPEVVLGTGPRGPVPRSVLGPTGPFALGQWAWGGPDRPGARGQWLTGPRGPVNGSLSWCQR